MATFLTTVFLGAVIGAIYALLASGLVLTYRTSGVFNFGQGALGMFFAYLFFQLSQGGKVNFVLGTWHQGWRLPRGLALVLVVVVLAPVVGWALESVLFSKLRAAGAVVQIVGTIGLLIVPFGLAGVLWGTAATLVPYSLFPRHSYAIGHVRLSSSNIGTLAVACLLCAALVAFLRFSPLGVRMRAVVDRPEVAEIMGVDSRRVAAVAWAIATGFAALAGILISPLYGSLSTTTLTFLVVAATAAAVVGRLESLPWTLGGGLGVGIVQLLAKQYVAGDTGTELSAAVPFLVLFAVLLLPVRWPETATAAAAPMGAAPGAPFGAEQDAVAAGAPTASPLLPAAPVARRSTIRLMVLAAVVLLPPFILKGVMARVFGPEWQRAIMLVPPMALIFLSLVIVSGYAGQISLCQASLAGFGAFVAAHLAVDQGMSLFAAAVIAGLAALPLGVVLAWRATRLPPLFLGLATLAFAALMDEAVLTNLHFAHGLVGISFNRPHLVHGHRAYYLFTLAVFAVAALLATNLRRGRNGLALVAMRDSQTGLAGLGASVARLKLVSFCLSAFFAGVGGALFAGARGDANAADWIRITSALFLALAVIGGIGRWAGALIGAAFYELWPVVFHRPVFVHNVVFKAVFHGQLEALLPVFFGLGAIGLAQNPNGVIEQTREGFAQSRERAAERRARREAKRSGVAVPAAGTVGAPGRVPAPATDGRLVACAKGRLYHSPSCALVSGKPVRAVGAARLRRLAACPVCEPTSG